MGNIIKYSSTPEFSTLRSSWSSFVNSHPNGNAFQLPWMYDFYAKVIGYEPICLLAVDSENKVIACLNAVIQREGKGIKARLSSRAIVSGGPLILNNTLDSLEIFSLLIKEFLKEVSSKTIYIELRNFFNWDKQYVNVLNNLKFEFEEQLNFIITLKKEENPITKFSESKRRQIKGSIKSGIEIIEANSIEQIKEFYSILCNLYKFRAKKPLADWSFFKNFFEINCRNKEGVYLLMQKDAKIIGGIMCILYNNTILYEWYVCGMDREYKQFYPSVMATYAAINYANEKEYKYFDFLGAGNPNEEYGVRDFKAKFGGETINYGRYLRINNPFVFKLGKSLVHFYSRFVS